MSKKSCQLVSELRYEHLSPLFKLFFCLNAFICFLNIPLRWLHKKQKAQKSSTFVNRVLTYCYKIAQSAKISKEKPLNVKKRISGQIYLEYVMVLFSKMNE